MAMSFFFFYDAVIRTQHTTLWKNLTRNFTISLLSLTYILFSTIEAQLHAHWIPEEL